MPGLRCREGKDHWREEKRGDRREKGRGGGLGREAMKREGWGLGQVKERWSRWMALGM